MSSREILTEIVIPLIVGFLGGSFGNIVIEKFRINKKHKMINKEAIFKNSGDFVNGDKK